MDAQDVILITLIGYKLVLISIGLWASRRTHSESGFLIGDRGLGGFVAGISYAASTSSAWVLLGFSGFVYTAGVAALWMLPGILGGYVIAWLGLGPKLRAESAEKGHVTLTDFLIGNASGSSARAAAITAALLIAFCFIFYIAAQFDAAATAFASQFGLGMTHSVILGAVIILIYCLLGGFWAVSVTDALQGAVMACVAVILPIATFQAAGSWEIFSILGQGDAAYLLDWRAGHAGWLLIGFVAGTVGVGLGGFGQPHLLNRLMAVRDDHARRQACLYTVIWGSVVYAGMAVMALSARAMALELADGEALLYRAAVVVLPAVLAGVVIAAVLSAVMSTVDSILLAAAGAASHDTGLARFFPGRELLVARITMVALAVLSVLLTLHLPATIFERVLFSWAALGAAFGPIVVARVMGVVPSANRLLSAMLSGFGVTVIFNAAAMADWGVLTQLATLPGDPFERVFPWVLPLLILFWGSRREVAHG